MRLKPGQTPLTKVVSLKMTAAQHQKYLASGGTAWLRQQIDGAPEPAPAQHSAPSALSVAWWGGVNAQ